MIAFKRSFLWAALSVASSTLFVTPVLAQESDKPAEKPANSQEEKKPEPPKRDQKAVDYEKAVKDLKLIEGPFPMYMRKKDVLLEISEDEIGKLFFVQSTFETGIGQLPQAGDPTSYGANDAFYFEKNEDKLWLVRPNIKYRWGQDNEFSLAALRSFPKAILGDYRIEQTNPETKKLLVNVSGLFTGELQNVNFLLTIAGGAQFNLDRDKSGPTTIYSNNNATVVRMGQHYRSSQNPLAAMDNPFAALFGIENQLEDSRSLPINLVYTLWYDNPKNDYQPRLADPRVGYFTNDFFNVDRFFKPDRTSRYINRWNIKKKDPTAAMSDPVKPIVWTLDHSIPEKWKPAVKEGVLRWNKSFEKLGLRNVVQVVDAPKDDPNYNHADGTRNIIRVTMTTNSPYAVALFRTNPLTGEIQNAAVTLDANFMSFVNDEFRLSVMPTSQSLSKLVKTSRAGLVKKSDDTPSARELALDTFRYRHPAVKKVHKAGLCQGLCDMPNMIEDHALNLRKLQANGIQMTGDEYVMEYIADVIAHEIGHCLGLRHNFVASTNLSTAELSDAEKIAKEGVAASVMDYIGANTVGILQRNPDLLFNKSVGPYDDFAIEYGYSDVNANSPEGELFGLNQIARKSGLPGHAFMTDEDADSWNPYVVRFDMAKDPLNYLAVENTSYRKVRNWAMTSLPRPGESFAERNQVILGTTQRMMISAFGASSFVGGLVSNRQFKGDINQKPNLTPVDGPTQRQAMSFIIKEVLSTDSVNIPDSILNSMALDFNSGEGSTFTAPIFSLISGMQQGLLGELMSDAKASQIMENELKSRSRSDRYTLEEHYANLLGATFREIGTGGAISPLRRELQNFAVEALMIQAGADPGAISATQRTLARNATLRLRDRFAAAKSSDNATREHIRGQFERLDRFVKRQSITLF